VTALWETLLAISLFAQNPAPVSPCPWLPEGSAAKALGGPVRVTVSVTSPTQGICTFSREGNPRDQLKVYLGTGNVPSCPAGSPELAGIGNRASRCRLPVAGKNSTLMISSKIRTTDLAVTLSTRDEDLLEQIAEQVAGNIF
jgi:hypothetical protein